MHFIFFLLMMSLNSAFSNETLPVLMKDRIQELLKIGNAGYWYMCYDTALYVTGLHEHFLMNAYEPEYLAEAYCKRLNESIKDAPIGSLAIIPGEHAFVKVGENLVFEKDGHKPYTIIDLDEALAGYQQSVKSIKIYDCRNFSPSKRPHFPEAVRELLDSLSTIGKKSFTGLDKQNLDRLHKIAAAPLTSETISFIQQAPEQQVTYLIASTWLTLHTNHFRSLSDIGAWEITSKKLEPLLLAMNRIYLERISISFTSLNSIVSMMARMENVTVDDFNNLRGHIDRLKKTGTSQDRINDLMQTALRNPKFLVPDKTPYIEPLAKDIRYHNVLIHIAVKNPSPMDWPRIRTLIIDSLQSKGLALDDGHITFTWEPRLEEEYIDKNYLQKLMNLIFPESKEKLRKAIIEKRRQLKAAYENTYAAELAKGDNRDQNLTNTIDKKLKAMGDPDIF